MADQQQKRIAELTAELAKLKPRKPRERKPDAERKTPQKKKCATDGCDNLTLTENCREHTGNRCNYILRSQVPCNARTRGEAVRCYKHRQDKLAKK